MNLPEIVEAIVLLINSSILDNQKSVLANIRDQLPFVISTTKSALYAEEESAKKLETRKVNVTELAKLNTKFEATKAKKSDLERGMAASQNEVARL